MRYDSIAKQLKATSALYKESPPGNVEDRPLTEAIRALEYGPKRLVHRRKWFPGASWFAVLICGRLAMSIKEISVRKSSRKAAVHT